MQYLIKVYGYMSNTGIHYFIHNFYFDCRTKMTSIAIFNYLQNLIVFKAYNIDLNVILLN
jgi:hypothetical protein